MKDFSNRISSDIISEATKDTYRDITTVEWNGISVEIKPYLELPEMLTLVENVVSMCFLNDSVEYIPEVKDYAVNSNIIAAYTNVDMPENIVDRYKLSCLSDLVDTVTDNIDINQLMTTLDAIDQKIDSIDGRNSSTFALKMVELLKKVEDVSDKMSVVFDGIDKDTIPNLMEMISTFKIDESKVVNSIIDKKEG